MSKMTTYTTQAYSVDNYVFAQVNFEIKRHIQLSLPVCLECQLPAGLSLKLEQRNKLSVRHAE